MHYSKLMRSLVRLQARAILSSVVNVAEGENRVIINFQLNTILYMISNHHGSWWERDRGGYLTASTNRRQGSELFQMEHVSDDIFSRFTAVHNRTFDSMASRKSR